MTSNEIDESIIEKIKSGDQDAFRELVKMYQQRAYYFCVRLVGHSQEAEDMAQEAFVKVFKNLKTFRGDSSFQTWFYQILLNLCRSHLRHRYLVNKIMFRFPEPAERDDESEISIETSIPDNSLDSDPLRATLNQELKKEIRMAIDSLPAQQKEVFTLKHFEGLKISEIAAITGNAEGTIKAHLFRAVQTLQKKLTHFKE